MEQIENEIEKLREQAREDSNQGNHESAEQTFLQALDAAEKKLGINSRTTIRVLADLAFFYRSKKGDRAQSEHFHRRNLAICEKVYGYTARPTLLILKFMISITSEDKSRAEETVALLNRAYEGYSKTFGSEDDETLRTMFQLIISLASTGSDQAEPVALKYFGTVRKLRGSDHADTIEAAMALVSVREVRYGKSRSQDRSYNSEEAVVIIAEVKSLYDQCPNIWGELAFMLGKMFLWCGDELNAHISFGFALNQQLSWRLCDGCDGKLGGSVELGGICRVCEDVYLCRSCYRVFGEALPQVIFATKCIRHPFYEVNVACTKNMDKDSWFANLLSRQNEKSVESGIPTSSNCHRTYLGEHPKADYAFSFDRVCEITDSKPDHERNPTELEGVDTDLQAMRICQVKDWVPRMLFNWFSFSTYASAIRRIVGMFPALTLVDCISHGPGEDSASKTQGTEVSFLKLCTEAESLIALALGPRKSKEQQSRVVPVAVSNTSQQGSIYRRQELILEHDKSQIRVLEIIGHDLETVWCKLRRVDLSDGPVYDALSYVWGPPEPSRQLNIDGICISIGVNLFNALCSIHTSQTKTVIWVDAVCINQGDLDERSHQVSMMATIYRAASKVRIYLGNMLPRWTEQALFSYWGRSTQDDMDRFDSTIERLGITKLDILNDFVAFLSMDWWWRIWVQQEYALAFNDPMFYLGTETVPASIIIRDIDTLALETIKLHRPFASLERLGSVQSLFVQTCLTTINHAMSVLNRRHEGRRGVGFLGPISKLFEHSNLLRCTDPRDKIFGIRELIEPLARELFPPNYRQGTYEVYEKLAVWLLMFDSWEEMFWFYPLKPFDERTSAKTPSWVPDFSKSLCPSPGSDTSSMEDSPHLSAYEPKINALPSVRDEAFEGRPTIYNGILALGGKHLDSISEVFHLRDLSFHTTLQWLWHLDFYFTSQCANSQLRKPSNFADLIDIHRQKLITGWVSFAGQQSNKYEPGYSVAFLQCHLTIPEAHNIMFRCEFRCREELSTIRKNTTITEFIKISEQHRLHQDPDPIFAQNEALRTENKQLAFESAVMGVESRIRKLVHHLLKGVHGPLDIVGAALFDFTNLCSQIKYLQGPSITADQYPVVARMLRFKLDCLLQQPPYPSTTTHEGPDGMRRPLYTDLQSLIVRCESEAEVKLRVRLVMLIAQSLNAAYTAHSSTDDSTSREETFSRAVVNLKVSNSEMGRARLEESEELIKSIGIADSENLREACSDFGRNVTEYCQKIPGIQNDFVKALQPQENWSDWVRFSRENELQWRNRTFFVTKKGFVGLGTPGVSNIRIGDSVILLENARMPLVIRQSNEEACEIVGFSIVREVINEDQKALEPLQRLQRRVFKFR